MLKYKEMKKFIYIPLIALALFTSCHNQDWEFSDFDYTTTYFPYQTPVRTLVLGEDLYDNSLDVAHKIEIMATMGGVYENKKDRTLDVVVDNSLCNNIFFEGDSDNLVLPMPAEYYSLDQSMKIVIPSGSVSGGIEVQLTDAFFADPKAIKNSYVIPLRITSVANIDSVLSGKSAVENPNRLVVSDWAVEPKDYVLYCVKYINPWHGAYLRRGVDIGKGNGNSALDTTITYHNQYVERDQVVKMHTVSMDEVSLAINTRDRGSDKDIPFELRIKVDNAGKCQVSAPDTASYTVTGSGEFVNDGDMWGGEKRDVMRLKYQIKFGASTHDIADTIVMRDRQVAFETFTPVVLK
jgi:hypothetical protein